MTTNRLLLISVLLFVGFGCNLFSGSNSGEIVLEATSVGTPIGDKVSKEIGPAGGSLKSADGRLTLTVPNGAVKQNTSFSIQPITNTVDTGIGAGYQLEPGDAAFSAPVELSVKYDDSDIEGTVPELLSMAYQDSKGAWHVQTNAKVDPEGHTVTIATTHFSHWLLMSFIKIIPVRAKVFVREQQFVAIASVCPDSTLGRWLSRNDWCGDRVRLRNPEWKLDGPGSLTPADGTSGAYYYAPDRKPSPNTAKVSVEFEIRFRNANSGELTTYTKEFGSIITIVDRGYKATGNAGPSTIFKGVICDLNAPFAVDAINPVLTFPLKFEPSSEKSGTWKYASAIPFLATAGGGTYAVEENSADHPPRIKISGQHSGKIPVISLGASGDAYIYLVPNDGEECTE